MASLPFTLKNIVDTLQPMEQKRYEATIPFWARMGAVAAGMIALAGCTVTQEGNKPLACGPDTRTHVAATYPGEKDYRAETDPHKLQAALKKVVAHEQHTDGALAMRVDQVGLDQIVCAGPDGETYLTVEATTLMEAVAKEDS